MDDLETRLVALSRVPVLLIASDYDGTLAPIVGDPAAAAPEPAALAAIRQLAAMPKTQVAVISGRSLRQLSEFVGSGRNVHLVGSHGSEFDPNFAESLPPQATELRRRLRDELMRIAAEAPGLFVERKPASIAFHYRLAEDRAAQAALRQILAGPAKWPGVMLHHGKRVLELAVVEASKARALERLRKKLSASAVLFLGDDLTDETAFGALTRGDVGVKVGEGETLAPFRVKDTREVAYVLTRICELRMSWQAKLAD